MDNEIQLISDGDGLAVIGDPTAVEEFLYSEGLWSLAKKLDLQRLKSLLGTGADVAQAASEIAANSGHWLKLTPESAHLVKKFGLMEAKTPGLSHAMVGKPGSIQKWLQIEQGPGSLLTNPAMLSSAAGLMAQVAMQQAMAEITDYLARIDEKVDDVLRKVDDTVRKDMIGAGTMIGRAMTKREAAGRVTDDSWSTVQDVPGKIADVQGYALLQLKAIATKMEGKRKVGGLAQSTREAEREVQEWLAILARCFQLQDAFDVLELDRALDAAPEELDACRRGLKADRQERLETISQHTGHLLDRMDAAVGMANAKIFWNRTRSPAVVQSGNHVATGVYDFHALLGIESDPRSWEERQLGSAAEMGSQAIQKTKDMAPYVAAGVGLLGVAGLRKKLQGQGTTEEGSASADR